MSALEMMRRNSIPPNPKNFQVWYVYYAGDNADLVRELDAQLNDGRDFTKERNEEIYETYFGLNHLGSEIRQTGVRVQSAVTRILGFLHLANKESNKRSKTLAEYSAVLSEATDSRDITRYVDGILTQAQQFVETSDRLANRLGNSALEMTELRQHLDKLRDEAITDNLTGLYNRRHFDECLKSEAAKAGADETDLCLVFADVDHFKNFNDVHGHNIGDKVLRLVGELLKEGVKGRDLPARLGGDEFVIILPQTALADAELVANQLREQAARREIKNRKSDQSYGSITLSIGVSQYRYGEPLEDFIQHADEALYRAKSAGRNRVMTWDGE
ncbi:MAG: GGDEF domain-containing protein [Sphingomonadales bacterium]